jgi:hypothetical protein
MDALTVWHIATGAQLTMVVAIAKLANNTGPTVSDLRIRGNSMTHSITSQPTSWITWNPEVTLGSLGEFETCPDWVPVMDIGQQFARIALKTMGDQGFDQRADRATKVRNVSRLGSQFFSLRNFSPH